jgi:hypothetical protein
MKQFLITLTFILPVVLFGCDNNNQKTISASATSTTNKDGEIVVREATKKEISSLDNFQSKIKNINNEYPPPALPTNRQTYKVLSISNDGVFSLDGGIKVKMSGIVCNQQGVAFIKKFFSEKDEKLSFLATETSGDGDYTPAFIWQVDTSLMNDPKMKGIITGPSFSNMNDNVILNNWCEIDFENQSKYHQRYIALEKISRKNKR